MADDTLSEQLDLDLWISLHNSRQLFREIYSSFSHLVSPLFPEFITDIKKFQTSLDLKSLRFPSEKIFKEG
jgi:hypothetical protein